MVETPLEQDHETGSARLVFLGSIRRLCGIGLCPCNDNKERTVARDAEEYGGGVPALYSYYTPHSF